MPIDDVSAKQEQLKRANATGSLNNEQAFRATIERFQEGVREHTPSVIEISTSAERVFEADMTNLADLAKRTRDLEIKRMANILHRSLAFLARTKGNL